MKTKKFKWLMVRIKAFRWCRKLDRHDSDCTTCPGWAWRWSCNKPCSAFVSCYWRYCIQPKETAKQIFNLLSVKGIPQPLFAKKVLNRSQGSFSDYLSKAPAEMPKMHSRAIWIKMEFLESQEQQQELILEMNWSKYCLSLLLYHIQSKTCWKHAVSSVTAVKGTARFVTWPSPFSWSFLVLYHV